MNVASQLRKPFPSSRKVLAIDQEEEIKAAIQVICSRGKLNLLVLELSVDSRYSHKEGLEATCRVLANK